MAATGLLTLACGLIAGRFHHQFGVAPILGAILCAACFLRPSELFLVGLGGVVIRDLWIGLSAFTLVRLVGIALVAAALVWIKIRPAPRSLLTGLLISSPIFHLSLAVGDWLTGTCALLPKTPAGLWTSIAASLPYFQKSFAGDLLFTGLFLGAYGIFAYTFLGRAAKAEVQ